MSTYKITTQYSEHFVEATSYTADANGFLTLWKKSNHAAHSDSVENVASFKDWIGLEKIDDTPTSLQNQIDELEKDKAMLMREHRQLLEISVNDLSKIKNLEQENKELAEKIGKLKVVVG